MDFIPIVPLNNNQQMSLGMDKLWICEKDRDILEQDEKNNAG